MPSESKVEARSAAPAFVGSHTLPRTIGPGVHWLGDCLQLEFEDRIIHGHMSAFLVVGERETLLVDTGHPSHWPAVQAQLAAVLGGRSLDWVFPTHQEMPHAGNLPRLARAYPDLRVVGDVQDYHLYFPELEGRLDQRRAGDSLDLGGRQVVFVPAVWRDLPTTLWAFDRGSKTLFPADGFMYAHHHGVGECARLASELDSPPSLSDAQYVNERAFFWTRYCDASATFPRLDGMLGVLDPKLIAPAHGGVIDNLAEMSPFLKRSLLA